MPPVDPCVKCGKEFPKDEYGGTLKGAREAKREHLRDCFPIVCAWCKEQTADREEFLEHAKEEHQDLLPDCLFD